MSTLGAGTAIKGELHTSDDITVAGRVEGPIRCDDGMVTLAETAEVVGDVMARDITVFGRVKGQLVATEVVDLRPKARVEGTIVAERLIVNDGATFNGRVEPQHLEAALRVAEFKKKKKPA